MCLSLNGKRMGWTLADAPRFPSISRPNGWLGDRRGTYRGLQRCTHCSRVEECGQSDDVGGC